MANIIAKVIAYSHTIKKNGTFIKNKSSIEHINDKIMIRPIIKNYLFNDRYDCVLVSYDDKYYICEKSSNFEYSKIEIENHPLIDDLKYEEDRNKIKEQIYNHLLKKIIK